MCACAREKKEHQLFERWKQTRENVTFQVYDWEKKEILKNKNRNEIELEIITSWISIETDRSASKIHKIKKRETKSKESICQEATSAFTFRSFVCEYKKNDKVQKATAK